MKVSPFWHIRIKHRHLDAWQRKDAAIRREYWAGRTPEEMIDFDRYRKLPAARRRAIEALYQQAA